jgi:hypothetical protein
MRTRNSPSQSDAELQSLPSSSSKANNTVWTEADEIALLDFMYKCKTDGTHQFVPQGLTFKRPFWTAAVALLEPLTTHGGPKTLTACQSKWDRVWIDLLLLSSTYLSR